MADRLRRALAGREVAAAFAVVAALYLIRSVRFQPTQIPVYLLIVAYDLVEATLPAIAPYHPVGFPVFLYLVAVVGAGIARSIRGPERRSMAVEAAGGVAVLVGLLSLAFAAVVGGPLLAPADNPTPLAITGLAGVVLVGGGWWLLGRPRPGGRD